MLLNFSDGDLASNWEPINDVVMGGASVSCIESSGGGTLVFSGELSLAHGGGFASIRQRSILKSVVDSSSLLLRVRGDGRSYNLRLLTMDSPGEHSYLSSFRTSMGQWTEHRFVPEDFAAKLRGHPAPHAPPLRFQDITGFAFLLADRQEGKFQLELGWILGC